MKNITLSIPLLLLVTSAALAVGGGSAEPSRTMNYASYEEISGGVRLIVHSRLAAYSENDPFMPLAIAVQVREDGPPLTLTPESFTLVDTHGRPYGPAAYEDVVADSARINWDRRMLALRPFLGGQDFGLDIGTESNFYPSSVQAPRFAEVRLDSGTWTRDLLYFPQPEAGIDGMLRLRLENEALDEPVEVRFKVP